VNTLQTHLSLLRRSLGDDRQGVVVREHAGYRLAVESDEVDAMRFERMVQLAGEPGVPPAERVRVLDGALALWRGPALADVADEPFARGDAVRLEELRAAATERRFDALLELGQDTGLIGELEAAARAHPYREHLAAQLALALYRAGRQADALRTIDQTRRTLADELGLEPTPEIAELEVAILRHDPALRREARPQPAVPAAPAPPVGVPLPGAVRARQSRVFGRDDELAWLVRQWDAVPSGAPRVVVLAGEAGIGKTTVASSFARSVHDDGAIVLWGRTSEEPLAPYQPIVTALDEVLRVLSPDDAAELLCGRDHLAVLVGRTEASNGDGRSDRLRLFDQVAGVFADLSRRAPVLLVVDDLHWAERSTTSLVTHLVRASGFGKLLVLATARSTAPDEFDAYLDLVADLRRDRLVDRMTLAGLDRFAVAELADAVTHGGSGSVAHELHAVTGGNPFFVEELAFHLVERGAASVSAAGVPDGIRDVLARRFERMSPATLGALAAAAVVGAEFSLEIVAGVAGTDSSVVLDALEGAVAAGFVVEVPDTVGRFTFAHAIVRRALLDRLGRTRLAQMHLAVADALAERGGTPTADEAYHRLSALPLGPVDRAVDAAIDAAYESLAVSAFDQAGELARRAVEVLESTGRADGDPRRMALALLVVADVTTDLGDMVAARGLYQRACELAVAAGDGPVAAGAALGYGRTTTIGAGFEFGAVDATHVALLEAALERVDESRMAAWVCLLSDLAIALYHAPDPSQRTARSDEAVVLAERQSDPGVRATALLGAAMAHWTPAGLPRRLEVARRGVGLAGTDDVPDVAVRLRLAEISALFELGRIDEAAQRIGEFAAVVTMLRRPVYEFLAPSLQVYLQLLRGEYDAAAAGMEAVYATASAMGDRHAVPVLLARRLVLGLDRPVEMPAIGLGADATPSAALPVSRLLLTLGAAAGGCVDTARESYAGLRQVVLEEDALWTAAVSVRADLAYRFSDGDTGARAAALLTPYAGRLASLATSASVGPVSRAIALGHAAAGDLAGADEWFAVAADEARRTGARPWLAKALADHAEVLVRAGDCRADQLRAEAASLAREVGMRDPRTPVIG
jgi:DNA-binding SARP family transcriptional activator